MRTSNIISIILHPIFMPIIALYLSLKLIPTIGFAITDFLNFIYLVLIFSTIILPLISVFFLIKKNKITSLEMKNFKERPIPLFITALWMGYGYYQLQDVLAFSPILRSEIIGAIIIIFTAAAISKYWKISLHMLGIGGVIGVLFGLNSLFGGLSQILMLAVLFAGILGSARIKEGAHNASQIYTGFVVGFFIEAGSILIF